MNNEQDGPLPGLDTHVWIGDIRISTADIDFTFPYWIRSHHE